MSSSYELTAFTNILVINRSSIGNLILSTPVACALKTNFSSAKITYLIQGEYKSLILSLCPFVDEVIDEDKYDNIEKLLGLIDESLPDLIVDLDSDNNLNLNWFTKVKYLKFIKPDLYSGNVKHLAKCYLDTISPVCTQFPKPIFPTLFPEKITNKNFNNIKQQFNIPNKPIIAMVAGINPNKASRSWLSEAWSYVIDNIVTKYDITVALVGYEEERVSCEIVRSQVEGKCINLAGSLDLTDLAIFLSNCEVLISGDTGINHLAVAVGTKTIGLYGQTLGYFTGPYGCEHLIIDQSNHCECHEINTCKLTNTNQPGRCMNRIMVNEVLDKINDVLGKNNHELNSISSHG